MSDEIFVPGVPETFDANIAETLRLQREDEEFQILLSLSAQDPPNIQNVHTDEDEIARLTGRGGEKNESVDKSQRIGVSSGAPDSIGTEDIDTSLPGADTVKAVAKDLAIGVTEAVPAILDGVAESVADTASLFLDAQEFVSEKLLAAGASETTVALLLGDPGTREEFQSILGGLQENDQRSVTGNMIREVANFSTGFFLIAGKIKATAAAAKLIAVAGKKFTTVVINAISGAITEFAFIDVVRDDLDILIEENPTIRNPVLEFMAGSPDDSPLEQRTRAALIGAGLGVAADTLLVTLTSLRGAIRSKALLKRAQRKAVEEARVQGLAIDPVEPPKITASEVSISGSGAKGPLVSARPALAAERISKAEKRLAKDFPDLTPDELRARAEELPTEIEINFDRLDTEDDIARLMQDATDLDIAQVKGARRGIRTNVQTEAEADQLGIDLGDVLVRRKGVALNAAQTTGYRRVWVAAASKVEELARIARDSRNDADVFRFRKALAVFNAINQSVLGARAESGRALQSWRITVAGDAERAAVIGKMVSASGGSRIGSKLAAQFLDAIASGKSPGQLNAIAKRGWFARTNDALKESAVIGLLWRPATHIANITANTMRIGTSIAEKGVAARIAKELLTENSVVIGEASAQMRGTTAALRAIFVRASDAEAISVIGPRAREAASSIGSLLSRRASDRAAFSEIAANVGDVKKAVGAAFPRSAKGQALKNATADSVAQTGRKIDVRMNAISAEGFGLQETSGIGKTVEAIGNAVRVPASFLSKADDLFKEIAFAGEVEGQAFRQATREGAAKGWNRRQIAERIEDLTTNPPENIRLEAGNAALYSTFTQDSGSAGQLLLKARDVVPGLVYVIPFVRTPMNVLRYGFEFSPMAPLVGQWRADIAAGGARQSIALARLAIGTSASAIFADYAWEGHIQGPLSQKAGVREAMLRQGLQAESIRVGGVTVRLNRFEPLSMNLSVSAALAQTLKSHQVEEEDFPEISEITAAIGVAMSQSVLDKTFFTGVSNLVQVIQYPDRRGARFLQKQMQVLFPFSSLIRTANQIITPERAAVASMGEAIQEMIIGLESRLPRSKTLWGKDIVRDVVDIVNPANVRVVKETPIDQEIVANQIDLQRIPRVASFGGVDVNFREFTRVFEKYQELAGNDLKVNGKGAFDTLNELVKTRRYQKLSRGPDGGRAGRIRAEVRNFRRRAQREILKSNAAEFQTDEFKRFRAHIEQRRQENRALRRPSVRNIQ